MIIGDSVSPTRYRIRLSGTEHYLRCGADILLNGLKFDIEGEGKCIVCGAITLVKMKRQKLVELEPQTAVLHVVEVLMEQGRLGIECESTPLFDKRQCLHVWLKGYRGRPGVVYMPQEFLDHMSRTRPDVQPIERS